mgnify:CR=1 FL=1
MTTKEKNEQRQTPYLDAYSKYLKEQTTVFDVPGHHQGKIRTDFDHIFGHIVYKNDVNCPRGMDNLLHPTGAIKEAQELFAKACHADFCKFLVNGSTSGNLIMIMSAVKANEKIIMPRNVHKSAINALILSGAKPVFIMPEVDKATEIVNQPTFKQWKEAIDQNLDAKAIFIINPTYFGATCDLKKVVKYAHQHNIVVLVDEAHGTHFYFSKKLPITAMDAGADMATLSIHKTGGSLTQSSALLLKGNRVTMYEVTKSFNLITTTSPSSILLASLDAARKFLVFKGSRHIYNAIKLARQAKERIDKIPGFIAHSKDYFLTNCDAYGYDETKLCVEIDKLAISGFDLYKILKDKYRVQIELAETYVFLLLFTIGSEQKDVDRIVEALTEISNMYYDPSITYQENKHFIDGFPQMKIRPRVAFHAPLKVSKLDDAINKISKEMIMIYPPGIPIIVPGEVFTRQVIDEIEYYSKIKATILSDWNNVNEVSVVDEDNWDYYKDDAQE